ncbi:hypothetical protein D021_1728A, partial [Vibrio parahaemolyticus 10296]
MKRVTNGFLS